MIGYEGKIKISLHVKGNDLILLEHIPSANLFPAVLESVWHANLAAFLLLDSQGEVLQANDLAAELLGYSKEDIKGQNIFSDGWQFVDLDDKLLNRNTHPFWGIANAGETFKDLKLGLRRHEKPAIYLSCNGTSFGDAVGREGKVLISFVDITGNVLSNRMLAQQLDESQALLQTSQMLASSLDVSQTLQQIVRAAITVIKQADQAVIHLLDESGDNLQSVAVADPSVDMLSKRMNFRPREGIAGLVIDSGRSINVADVLKEPRFVGRETVSGRVRSLLVAPVKTTEKNLGTISLHSAKTGVFSSDDERLLTTLGSQAAIALEKAQLHTQIQETLQQEQAARAQLVQSEKLAALGRIIASVAHELNNPLQAIQNALYLVNLQSTLDQQSREDIQVALNESSRMAELIARLRDTYRPTSGEEFQNNSLDDVVLDVQKLIGTYLRHSKVSFHFEPNPSLPVAPIIRDQIKQVVLNICLNAVESMEEGGELSIDISRGEDKPEIEMRITDTGPGISPRVLKNIFDPFFTTKEGGTGLGLAITYDIIRRHNGRIDVQSVLGQGTTFTVVLPLKSVA